MTTVALFDDSGKPVERAMGGGLEGAERTSRETFTWTPPIISPDRQINPLKEMADARSRDTVQNDGRATGALNFHRDSVVGSQFRLNSTPNWQVLGATEEWAEEFQQWAESEFNMLAESQENWFDAARQNTFTGLVRLAVGGFLLTGEVLGTAEWLRAVGRPFRTAIQMVSPSRLSNPDGMGDDQFLRRGVKRDMYGGAIGYYIRTAHPGDQFFNLADQPKWTYVPATKPWGRRMVIHIIDPMQPDQTRGVSEMVAVLKQMRMTRKFSDVVLQNAVVNASYAAAIESELPKEMIYGALGGGQQDFTSALGNYMSALSSYVGSSNNIQIDGVKLPHLFPGTKLNLQPMGTPGGVGTDFEDSLHAHIAAGLGMSLEEYSKDFSKTNYSSIRAAGLSTQRYMASRKRNVADRFANHVYTLWLEEKINAGAAPLPKGMGPEVFYDPLMREALTACEWIGASKGQIDELKETQAAVMRISAGLSTYEKEVARLGDDWRKLFTQRQRENKMMEKLNLTFSTDAAQPGANDAQQSMRNGQDGTTNTSGGAQ